MTQPLIVVAHERLLPGSQLVNRLEDQGYRVVSVSDPALIVETAEREKPLLVIVDMEPSFERFSQSIVQLTSHPTTSHIPIIALTSPSNAEGERAARSSGATLVVGDSAILIHLDQFIQQALEI